jgi:GcrA cell cycle regulator
MGGHVNTIWTDEQSEALTTMLATGKSFSQIAAELNAQFNTNYSRNAACGKGYRLGLAAPQKVKAAPKKRKRGRDRAAAIKPLPRVEEIQLRCAEIEPRHLTLDQLEPNDCRYPFGEGPQFTFCGRVTDGGSYCTEHFHLTKMRARTNSEAVTNARARRMRGINFRRALLENAR